MSEEKSVEAQEHDCYFSSNMATRMVYQGDVGCRELAAL